MIQLDSLVFNEEEVYAALVQLDPNKATGIGKISPKVLKHCGSSLFRPLCHLFNLSLSIGAIPTEWKIHLITSVYKSADRSLVKNYRPISLLCIASKVLETLIHSVLLSHTFNYITIHQFSFLPRWSTTQQLLLYLKSVYQASSHGQQTDSIYLDFRKAFDSVPHSKLLLKLRQFNFSGKLWE